jgi:hypothetical protein
MSGRGEESGAKGLDYASVHAVVAEKDRPCQSGNQVYRRTAEGKEVFVDERKVGDRNHDGPAKEVAKEIEVRGRVVRRWSSQKLHLT